MTVFPMEVFVLRFRVREGAGEVPDTFFSREREREKLWP
jgi:hypothetical protein